MKQIATALLLSVSLSALGGSRMHSTSVSTSRVAPVPIRDAPEIPIPPIDPIRVVNGQIEDVKLDGWVNFEGVVLKVQTNGIYVSTSTPIYYGKLGESFSGQFFVEHFPYQVAENDRLRGNYFAKIAGVCTVSGQTIHKLDYYQIWKPQPPRQLTQSEKATNAAKALKFHQAQADKGDDYGQLQMGLRFLKGDGVEVDLVKARQLFKKSADQGNKEAANQLKKMDVEPPTAALIPTKP